MSSAYAVPIAMAAMSAVSSFTGSMSQQAQARAQASNLEAQADMARKQGEIVAQKGESEARAIERQKREIRRKFEAIQGKNRANLGAGFVDMTSGSPLEISLGNIDRFAEDMGENAYEAALKRWEAETAQKNYEYQASMYDAQSDNVSQSAGNLMTSLLGAGMAGFGSYMMGGMQTGIFTEAPNAGVNTVAGTINSRNWGGSTAGIGGLSQKAGRIW